MKFDVATIRLLNRLADRMDAIRKNPQRYDIDPEDNERLTTLGARLEEVLVRVRTLKAG